jgi:hypothetical protein
MKDASLCACSKKTLFQHAQGLLEVDKSFKAAENGYARCSLNKEVVYGTVDEEINRLVGQLPQQLRALQCEAQLLLCFGALVTRL